MNNRTDKENGRKVRIVMDKVEMRKRRMERKRDDEEERKRNEKEQRKKDEAGEGMETNQGEVEKRNKENEITRNEEDEINMNEEKERIETKKDEAEERKRNEEEGRKRNGEEERTRNEEDDRNSKDEADMTTNEEEKDMNTPSLAIVLSPPPPLKCVVKMRPFFPAPYTDPTKKHRKMEEFDSLQHHPIKWEEELKAYFSTSNRELMLPTIDVDKK